MFSSVLRFLFLFFVVANGIFGAAHSQAQTVDSAESLQLSVRRLNAWLGAGEQAEGWRQALWLGALESQAARGYSADPMMLSQILQRFDAGNGSLTHPAFQDVRRNLANHLGQFQNSGGSDLPSMLAQARVNFRPLGASDIFQARDEVVWNLQLMQRQYDKTRTSADRATLYEKLKLNEFMAELNAIDFVSLVPNQSSAPGEPVVPSEDTETEEQKQARLAKIESQRQEAAIAQEQADRDRNTERTRVLRSLLAKVREFEDESLENPDIWMMSSAIALDRFVRVVAAATSTQTETEFQELLTILEQNLFLLDDPRQQRAMIDSGDAIGKLIHSRQVPGLIAAIRRKYDQPNLELTLSTSLLSAQVNRTNSEVLPVEELILGRLMKGSALSSTNVTLEFHDNPHQVSASIHMQGTVDSSTSTKQGPITASSDSLGLIEARRNIHANVGGFYVTEPYVAANVSSNFKGVDCRLRLVQRIAQKQYQKDKVEAEGIGAARTEKRINEQFGPQTEEALNRAREQFGELQPTLFDVGRWVPEIALSSSYRGVHAIAAKSDPARLGANGSAPAARINSDARLSLHQSMVTNYVDPLIAGRKFTNEELGELAKKLTGEIPEAFQQKDESESWSITFPPTGAISVQFVDQTVLLDITGRRFTQADQQIVATLAIKLKFQVVLEEGKMYLRQIDKPSIDYVDESQKNVRTVGFKNFLEGKLEDGYDASIKGTELSNNLIPVDRIERQEMKDIAQQLQLVEFRIEDGWLMGGWIRQPAYSSWTVTTFKPAIQAGVMVAPFFDPIPAGSTKDAGALEPPPIVMPQPDENAPPVPQK